MARETTGRQPARSRLGAVILALGGVTASLGCDGTGDTAAPASYRVTAAGTGAVNELPVARLVPGTRAFSSTQGVSWSVGAVRPDGTTHVAFKDSTLVLRDSERGLEFLGALGESEMASRAPQGTSGLVIETQRPITDAEVIVPRALRVGMTWRTGADERSEYRATAVNTVSTPVGPRRLWTIAGPSRVFLVMEGVGPVAVQQTFDPADLAFDVIVVAPVDAPPRPAVAARGRAAPARARRRRDRGRGAVRPTGDAGQRALRRIAPAPGGRLVSRRARDARRRPRRGVLPPEWIDGAQR